MEYIDNWTQSYNLVIIHRKEISIKRARQYKIISTVYQMIRVNLNL